MPSQDELVVSIKEVLKTADLDSLSAKQVRKQLEKEHGCDLTEHKKFIDTTIMTLIDERETVSKKEAGQTLKRSPPLPAPTESNKKVRQDSSSGSDLSEDLSPVKSDHEDLSPVKSRKRSSAKTSNAKTSNAKTSNAKTSNDVSSFTLTSNRTCKKPANRGSKTDVRVSPELAKIIGAEVLPMSEISLRLHQEVLTRQLHEGTDKLYISCDEDFRAVFRQDRVRVSTLTNHCKRHIHKIEKEKSSNGKVKRNSMYSKKLWLSPLLSDVLGYNYMPRHSVVKEMWVLIKERGLQDPKNKKFMLVEEDMRPLFKSKRIKTFGMMKYLAEHMADDENEFEYDRSYPEYSSPDQIAEEGS